MPKPTSLAPSSLDVQRDQDIRLMRRVAQQDESALEALYERYSGPLFSLIFKMLNNNQEAEEVLQDAFVRIWKRADRYDPARSAFFTWAVQITRNLCIDRLRSRHKITLFEDHLEGREIVRDNEEDSRRRLIRRERSEQVRKKLDQLPENQRVCIELAFFKGLTHHEIAAQLEEPLGTIKARIRRGMQRMKIIMEGIPS